MCIRDSAKAAPAPVAAPQITPSITPERSARIDAFVRDNATHRGGFFNDSDGGTRTGRALRGESDLGALTAAERDALAARAASASRSAAVSAPRSDSPLSARPVRVPPSLSLKNPPRWVALSRTKASIRADRSGVIEGVIWGAATGAGAALALSLIHI